MHKKAIICGGSQGIGKAISLELLSKGYSVLAISRSEPDLKDFKTVEGVNTENRFRHLQIDLNSSSLVSSAIQEECRLNGPYLVLINNSGGPLPGSIMQATPDAFRKAFEQHVIANQILVQAVVPSMKSQCFGRIINIISTSVKQPLPGLGVSNTIRAAVANWSKTLSRELAPFGITVNNVLPGATLTSRLKQIIENKANTEQKSVSAIEAEMLSEIPTGRFAKPEEIASVVSFLCSEAASYITGINLPVDGGRTLSL